MTTGDLGVSAAPINARQANTASRFITIPPKARRRRSGTIGRRAADLVDKVNSITRYLTCLRNTPSALG
jgi:hypothetical protein